MVVGIITQREGCPLRRTPLQKPKRELHPNRYTNCNIKTRNMKNQGNRTSPKAHSSSITEFKDTGMIEISYKEFNNLVFKMISILKED
jgi:hypothetical protein